MDKKEALKWEDAPEWANCIVTTGSEWDGDPDYDGDQNWGAVCGDLVNDGCAGATFQMRKNSWVIAELKPEWTAASGEYLRGEKLELSQVKRTKHDLESKWQEGELPPVGTRCEAMLNGKFQECEIIKQKVNSSGMKVAACDFFDAGLAWAADFRPIRTERDKAIDAARDLIDEVNECVAPPEALLIDALDSGKIPGYGRTDKAREALSEIACLPKVSLGDVVEWRNARRIASEALKHYETAE